MPLSKYFGGHGAEVMKKMKDKYGEKKGESVFYATANKEKGEKEHEKKEHQPFHTWLKKK